MRSPLSTFGRIPARFLAKVTGRRHHTPAYVKRAIGAATIHYRERAGMSMTKLAEAAGLSPSSLLSIERGESEPRWGTVRGIAAALGVPLPEFVGAAEKLERGESLDD